MRVCRHRLARKLRLHGVRDWLSARVADGDDSAVLRGNVKRGARGSRARSRRRRVSGKRPVTRAVLVAHPRRTSVARPRDVAPVSRVDLENTRSMERSRCLGGVGGTEAVRPLLAFFAAREEIDAQRLYLERLASFRFWSRASAPRGSGRSVRSLRPRFGDRGRRLGSPTGASAARAKRAPARTCRQERRARGEEAASCRHERCAAG
jgi:hypothetical protein